jgi:hypothetical protein
MLANALLKRPAAHHLLESATKPALSATLMNLNRHQQPQQEQRSGAHTDIQFPNFDAYRYDACKDTTGKGSTRTADDRRGLPHAIFYGGFCFIKTQNLMIKRSCSWVLTLLHFR